MRCITTLLLLSAITSSVFASPPSSRSTRSEPVVPPTPVRVSGSFDAPDILRKPGTSFPSTSPYSTAPDPIPANVSWPASPAIPVFRKSNQPGWVSERQILSSQGRPAVYAPAPRAVTGTADYVEIRDQDTKPDRRVIQVFRLKNTSAKSLVESLKIHLKASHPGHFEHPQQVQISIVPVQKNNSCVIAAPSRLFGCLEKSQNRSPGWTASRVSLKFS